MGDKNKNLAKPNSLQVLVQSPGGAPIQGALVRLKRGTDPNDDVTARTDATGIAVLELRESDLSTGTDNKRFTIQASKHHHGPVPDDRLTVKNGPKVVQVDVTPQAKYAPGTANVDSKGRLVMVLVDGCTLGRLHSSILARRLSTDEVVEELMYSHARGILVIQKGHEFPCKHDPNGDPDGEAGDPCTSQCQITAPAQDTNTRLTVAAEINGVNVVYITGWWKTNATTPAILWTGRTVLQKMYRRNVVALTRLCALLAGSGYKVLYTGGVEGSAPAARNDSHGQGRAMDFHGAAKEMPLKGPYRQVWNKDKTKLLGSGNEADVRLGTDFIIWYHWGMMQLQVQKPPAAAERKVETHLDYDQEGQTPGANGQILYRLDPLPPAGARPSSMTLTDAHLTEAQTLFKNIFDFVVRQYSHRETKLGPIRFINGALAQAAATADDTSPIPRLGGLANQVLHPDYPRANTNPYNGREAHVNHFHVQFGITATMQWSDLP